MNLELTGELAIVRGHLSVEAAEALLEWVQQTPQGKVDLSVCEHLHAAPLQVLMAANVKVLAWPADPAFADWLRTALEQHVGE